MALDKTEKQSWERYFVYGDFSDVMATGETITDSTVTAIDSALEDASIAVLDEATKYSEGPLLFIRIKDGVESASPYKFTVRVETSTGNRWEVDGEIKIKEI